MNLKDISIENISDMLKRVRKRALEKQIPFDLTKDWYLEKLSLGVCEETGITFDLGPYNPSKGVPPHRPTIDRVDSSKGYTIDNCKLVVMIYNQAKNDKTKEELLKWGTKFIERYENETLLG